jgi:hypothetical protein
MNKAPLLLYADAKIKDGDAFEFVITVYFEHPSGPPHPNFLSKGSIQHLLKHAISLTVSMCVRVNTIPIP